jgi:hypothetical protein
LTIEGDGVIEAFAWETERGVALHLVNYTNPNMMRGWVRQFYPTSPLRVQLAVPSGRAVRRGRALRAGRDVALTVQGDRLRFETPPVADYEVIALTET